MASNKIYITNYAVSDRPELLRLLLELHSTYFFQTTSMSIQEIRQDKNMRKSYESYLDIIDNNKDGTWQIFLAKTHEDNIIGFSIGSISTDEDLVLSKIGKFEDWFVEHQFRGQGIGVQLYNQLEKWFIKKECRQISSETWQGNQLSIKAHQKLGFFVSEIKFSKKL